jgi:hypothetical protein
MSVKQLERTVIRHRMRAACAAFHCAHAARPNPQHAAAEQRRYTALETARFSRRAPDALRTFIPPTRMHIGSEGRAHERNA